MFWVRRSRRMVIVSQCSQVGTATTHLSCRIRQSLASCRASITPYLHLQLLIWSRPASLSLVCFEVPSLVWAGEPLSFPCNSCLLASGSHPHACLAWRVRQSNLKKHLFHCLSRRRLLAWLLGLPRADCM
uniref:Uncharacterized protein n=1 Tax=Kalanchoe fedtschenkoi TaxID=63787 RepID=A0A7N0ZXP3_KALFE